MKYKKVLCMILVLICAVLIVFSLSGCGCDNTSSKKKDISFVVGTEDARQGEKGVALTVEVKNNPGFASARLEICCDKALTLTGFTYNASKLNGASTVPFSSKADKLCLSVTNTAENITGDFDFATLYFDVSDKAKGSCEVTLSCEESDVYDIEENNLNCTVTAGKINVTDTTNVESASEKSSGAADSNDSSGKHTVVFKDENGNVISTQSVKDGEAAPAPTAPTKEGYAFKGWSESVEKITSDKTVTPIYVPIGDAPLIEVEKVEAKPGDEKVAVTVSLKNNPGIASALLDILYDKEKLTLTGFEYNTELLKGSSTVPFSEKASTPALSFVNGAENIIGDGVLATLYFDISDDAKGGYPIVLSYDKNNVYNIDEENVTFETVNGTIEIE